MAITNAQIALCVGIIVGAVDPLDMPDGIGPNREMLVPGRGIYALALLRLLKELRAGTITVADLDAAETIIRNRLGV